MVNPLFSASSLYLFMFHVLFAFCIANKPATHSLLRLLHLIYELQETLGAHALCKFFGQQKLYFCIAMHAQVHKGAAQIRSRGVLIRTCIYYLFMHLNLQKIFAPARAVQKHILYMARFWLCGGKIDHCSFSKLAPCQTCCNQTHRNRHLTRWRHHQRMARRSGPGSQGTQCPEHRAGPSEHGSPRWSCSGQRWSARHKGRGRGKFRIALHG